MPELNENQEGRKRAEKGEGTVYWDAAKNTFCAELSVGRTRTGRRKRLKAYGKTEAKAKKALRDKLKDFNAGLDTSTTYTVADAVNDWHKRGQKAGEETRKRDRYVIDGQIIPAIGGVKLKELTADDVDDMLIHYSATHATSTLKKIHSVLNRAIKHAQRRDKVGRNVAALIEEIPEGKPGRPSKSMSPEQVKAVFKASKGTWFHAYLVVSNMTGIRTEEVRPLEWKRTHLNPVKGERCTCDQVHTETLPPHVEVWRSVRVHGDTKTQKSRRTIALPKMVVAALFEHRESDLAWRAEHGYSTKPRYVFGTRNNTVKLARNVRRFYRSVLTSAGLNPDEWCPRETRHTFVSIMSDLGADLEMIADLVGHKDTRTTRQVYRHQLRPVITKGAEMIEAAFSDE
ncbi:site-specific integrase [Glycomyces tritici]|uniref:Site-specific integrase n=1 Tax=Glycomyces tritici TaxID=2665176 RepID=A0ABT7YRI8_9ACTN|nr:site-specific integrase [Glycomyces tritici]MDN3240994.1 site-specific integrase [Glycomyces tritici]